MIYGSRQFKNGKTVGYLEFSTGKIVYLNAKEKKEFELKIELWQWEAVEKATIKLEADIKGYS